MASHLRVPLASTQGALPIREALVVTFLVDTQLRLVHFTADFLDPDGERVVRIQGVAAGGDRGPLQGHFSKAGPGTLRLRGLTDQGVSGVTELKVTVR